MRRHPQRAGHVVSDSGLPTKFFPSDFDRNHNNAMQKQLGARRRQPRPQLGWPCRTASSVCAGHPTARPVPGAHAGLPRRKPHVAHREFTETCARFVGGRQVAAGQELPEGHPFGQGDRALSSEGTEIDVQLPQGTWCGLGGGDRAGRAGGAAVWCLSP